MDPLRILGITARMGEKLSRKQNVSAQILYVLVMNIESLSAVQL